jgi:endoglucanase
MTNLLPLLKQLCDTFGPSGFESEVRQMIRSQVETLGDLLEETPIGNLIVTRRGADPTKTLMLDAHMDEIGYIVTHVDEHGFLRFAPLGSIDPRVVASQRVEVRAADGSKHLGVIGVLPPHVTRPEERNRVFDFSELFIDLGCASAHEVTQLGIRRGSPAVPYAPLTELAGGCVTAKALDDRTGCALLIALLEAFRETPPPVNLVASFSMEEETGGLGAQATTNATRPDVAFVLENTTATDTPGVPSHRVVTSLRQGPALTLADARTIVPEKITRFVEEQAQAAGLPLQIKLPGVGGTNATRIQSAHAGVLTGILSVPCRYIHSSVSLLNLSDAENARALLVRLVNQCVHLWKA